jgi:hypothetical protein
MTKYGKFLSFCTTLDRSNTSFSLYEFSYLHRNLTFIYLFILSFRGLPSDVERQKVRPGHQPHGHASYATAPATNGQSVVGAEPILKPSHGASRDALTDRQVSANSFLGDVV